jgi:hypothetical protein
VSETNGLIYKQIPAIMAKVPAVGKNDYNAHQKFHFRGIDAVMNAVAGLLAEHEVFSVPEVTASQVERYETTNQYNKPVTKCHAVLTVQYTFFASDGSSVAVVVVGEAIDSGDKAANKAMAAAYKYALCQLFCIKTLAGPDPDDDAPQQPNGGAAQQAEKFLNDKAKKKATPPAKPAALTPEVQKFRAVVDELAQRDLPDGFTLGEADYKHIGLRVMELGDAHDAAEAATWLHATGALQIIDMGNGDIGGIEVLATEPQTTA